jgi:hypothetical protein
MIRPARAATRRALPVAAQDRPFPEPPRTVIASAPQAGVTFRRFTDLVLTQKIL